MRNLNGNRTAISDLSPECGSDKIMPFTGSNGRKALSLLTKVFVSRIVQMLKALAQFVHKVG